MTEIQLSEKLIPVYKTEGGKQVSSARDLHLFLGVKERFSDWINRHLYDLGSVEGKDFIRNFGKSTGGRPTVDFYLTAYTCQHIGMMQRTDKGKQIRDFYIKVVDAVRNTSPAQQFYIPQNYADALLLAANQAKEIEEMKPKAEYAEKVLQSKSTWVTTVIAKELGMSAIALNRKLKELGIQYKRDGVWVLCAKYQNKGYTDTRTHIYHDSKGDMCTSIESVWTETGRNFVYQKINGVSISPNETFAQNCA